MGKSAGKWIKTVLFGKKYSKSNLSKNVTPDKLKADKAPIEDISPDSPVISDPYQLTESGVETLLELEKGTSGPQCDAILGLSPVNQGVDSQSNNGLVPGGDADMTRQEQAAAKVQAAFRSYLARRAFRALKGIIRLQALIRGHLVRRQAVVTLRCMQAILKFQALARGLKDAKQVYVGANSFLGSKKLATNTFVRKLLVKMPTAIPLSLQYDVNEPNSAWIWLERWSVSHFWEPPARAKRIAKPKPQRKPGGPQIVEPEAVKSKRTIRKIPTASNGENGALASEMDKPKRNPGKFTSNQMELAQEQAQSELEMVKRNLRKVSSSSPSVQVPEKSEMEIKKSQPIESVDIVEKSAPPDVPELKTAIFSENQANSHGAVDILDILETRSENEPVDASEDIHAAIEAPSSENGARTEENPLNLDDESSFKEEQSGKVNQKIKKRRSLPAKQEFSEKILQNSPSCLPSYMAATKSAKAKLRGQGSSKFGEDGVENGNARRHSLPAYTNGKMNSPSPRVQKPVQSNGKGGSKTNMALMSPRDDKVVQLGWRR
ncbi:hypothetical protein OROGR_007698 [Orobanche gracilis]